MKYFRLSITIQKIPTKEYYDFEEVVESKIEENKSTSETFRYKIHRTDVGWFLESCNIVLAGDKERIKTVKDCIVALVKPKSRGLVRKRYKIKFSELEEKEGTSINLDSDL